MLMCVIETSHGEKVYTILRSRKTPSPVRLSHEICFFVMFRYFVWLATLLPCFFFALSVIRAAAVVCSHFVSLRSAASTLKRTIFDLFVFDRCNSKSAVLILLLSFVLNCLADTLSNLLFWLAHTHTRIRIAAFCWFFSFVFRWILLNKGKYLSNIVIEIETKENWSSE